MLTYLCVKTDDDFRDFVDQVPRGCKITIISDSCHSGGLIDDTKEQIGESTEEGGKQNSSSSSGFRSFLSRTVEDAIESRGVHIPSIMRHRHKHEDEDEEERDFEVEDGGDHGYVKNRSLPLSTLIEILKQKTGKDDIDVGKLRPTLFDVFGEDASPKVKKFMKVALNMLEHKSQEGGFLGKMSNLAQEFLKQKLNENDEGYAKPALETRLESEHEVYAGSTKHGFPPGEVLLSGCQTDQTSADACPSGDPSRAYGAFSNAIQAIIEETDGVITYHELVTKAREKLKKQGYKQRPGLYCSDDHVDAYFLR